MAQFTIGRLAQESGVSVETIRYYERQGLLVKGERRGSGYRIYPAEATLRIRFIKRAQELGFSLKEINDLLSLRKNPGTTQAEIRERAQGKLADIEQKLKHLEIIRASLLRLMDDCSGCGPLGECPILESLDGKELA